MSKKERVQLSKFEFEVMEILWRLGEASVREVQEAIHERKRPAYTTVQTIFARLEAKKAVQRTRKIGNAYVRAADHAHIGVPAPRRRHPRSVRRVGAAARRATSGQREADARGSQGVGRARGKEGVVIRAYATALMPQLPSHVIESTVFMLIVLIAIAVLAGG